jgi:hypothetical protein
MDLTIVLIGFAMAAFVGAAVGALLALYRPAWPRRRRVLVAASVLPAMTLLATLATFWSVRASRRGPGSMEDLAGTAVMTLGGGFVLLAFVGGLIGAGLSQRKR